MKNQSKRLLLIKILSISFFSLVVMLIVLFILTGYWPFPNELSKTNKNIGKPIKQLQESDKRYKEHGNEEWYFEESDGVKWLLYVENGILTGIAETASKSLFPIEWHKLKKNIGKPIKQLQESDKLKRYKEYGNEEWYFEDSEGIKWLLYVENGILTGHGSGSLKSLWPIARHKLNKNIGKPIKQLQESDKLRRYKEYSNGRWFFEDSDEYKLLLYVEDGILVGIGERRKYVSQREMNKVYKNIGKPIKQLQENDKLKRYKRDSNGRWYYEDLAGFIHFLNVGDGILTGIENGTKWASVREHSTVYKNIGKPIKQLQASDKRKRYKKDFNGRWYYKDSEGSIHFLNVGEGILTGIGSETKAVFKPEQAEEPRAGNDILEEHNRKINEAIEEKNLELH